VVVATLLVGGQKLLFDLPFVLYLHGLFFAPGGGLIHFGFDNLDALPVGAHLRLANYRSHASRVSILQFFGGFNALLNRLDDFL